MPIFGDQGALMEMSYTVAGQGCRLALAYHPETPGVFTSPALLAAAFNVQFISKVRTIMTDEATVNSVLWTTNTPPGVPAFPPDLELVNLAGIEPGDTLPPYVSGRIYKVPDIALEEPSPPPNPWRQGMIRLSGLSEDQQSNGIANAALVASMQSLADYVVTVNPSAGVFRMHYARFPTPTDPTTYAVPVQELYSSQLLGSQNTRKIGR